MLRALSARTFVLTAAIALAPFALNAQATTTCKDGTTSTATGKGACSGHGGVDKGAKVAKVAKSDAKATSKAAKADVKADVKSDTKAAKADTKVAKSEAKATTKAAKSATAPVATASKTTASNTDPTGATAKCKDGTYSHAQTHRGACSRHGGVAEWLKT